MRKIKVLWHEKTAGFLSETNEGYVFQYDNAYLDNPSVHAISLTFPLQREPFISKTMFSFFDGLIPEGWLLDIAQETWKINPRDRMGLLMVCCKDCIGAVSMIAEEESDL
ncbi:MAG: HipA N-terminal domain-containing protein [Candidatus Neomarinimicrobiota bacterium]